MQERDDIVALDSAIILHPRVWEASGHVAGFTDPLVDCRTCKLRFRADHSVGARRGPVRPQAEQAPGRDPECDLTEARAVQPHVRDDRRRARGGGLARRTSARRPRRASSSTSRTSSSSRGASRRSASRRSASRSATRSRRATSSSATREFEQMEMEFFVPPDEAEQWFRYWVEERYNWYTALRPAREPPAHAASTAQDELSHYSSATSDIEYLYPDRLVRARGSREPRRLRPHAAHGVLGDEARVRRPGRRALRPVRDRARGRHRAALLAFLVDAYDEEIVGRARADACSASIRAIAPVKAAILPLIGKSDDMVGKARVAVRGAAPRLHRSSTTTTARSAAATAGRTRSARPWAFTIDEQTLEDDTVDRARPRLARAGARADRRRPAWLDDALARAWKTPKGD